jgi:hypothetical protein
LIRTEILWGDLTGSYPGPIVKGLQTYPIDPRTPNNGETLVFNGGEWIPTPAPISVTFFQGVWDADTSALVGGNFVMTPGTIIKLLWTGLGGNGAWIQTAKAVTVA